MELVFISGWATNSLIWGKVQQSLKLHTKNLEWIDVIKGEYALPKQCILVGWSLGGQLALNMLQNNEVKGACLISSMSNITSAKGRPGVDANLYRQITKMIKRSRKGYLSSFFKQCGANQNELEGLMNQSESFTDAELISGLDMMFNKEVSIPTISNLPISIIHGTNDKVIPYECSTYIQGNYFENSASLLTIPAGNHYLPLSHPDRITKAVIELVERVNP